MPMPSRQAVVLMLTLVAAVAIITAVITIDPGPVRIAFWFEEISEKTRGSVPERLGGTITDVDLEVIESMAAEEVARAFEGFPVDIRRPGDSVSYRVRVVDTLERPLPSSGQSHVIVGLGGQGFVNFSLLADGAAIHARPNATRDEMVAGIGRGIGRAAVHEFAHQILGGGARIDDVTDRQTYEYGSADRIEQYYGPMRWGIAGPLLRQKLSGRSLPVR